MLSHLRAIPGSKAAMANEVLQVMMVGVDAVDMMGNTVMGVQRWE